MKVLGEKIKRTRLKLGMTQSDLAKGISKQPTISNIENRNAVESFAVLYAICERLNLDVSCVIEEDSHTSVEDILKKVDYLCIHDNHKKALLLLEKNIPLDVANQHYSSELYYFYGITNVMEKKNFDQGAYFFIKVIEMNGNAKFKALAKNGLGIINELKGNYGIAKEYYEESISTVKNSVYSRDKEVLKIYYNAAKFFSLVEDYERAYDLSEDGYQIAQENQSTYLLEYISYEKAFNARKLNMSDYLQQYNDAGAIARFNNNVTFQNLVISDLEDEQN